MKLPFKRKAQARKNEAGGKVAHVNNLTEPPKFSRRQLLVFGAIFLGIGAGLLVFAFADNGPQTDNDLNNVGTTRTFRNGTLVQAQSVSGAKQPNLYVIGDTAGKYAKRLVPNRDVMTKLGYTDNDILIIPESLLPKKDGSRVTADKHPVGTAVRVKGQSTVWLIQPNSRVKFSSSPVLRSYSIRVYDATAADMKLPERKATLSEFREGAVIKVVDPSSRLNGNIYHIERHGNPAPLPKTYQKNLITPAGFQALGYKDSEIINATEDMLPKATGPNLTEKTYVHAPGTIIRFDGDNKYWRVTSRGKLAYSDVQVLRGNGYSPGFAKKAIVTKPTSDTSVPPPPAITAASDLELPVTQDLGFRNGTLVEPHGEDPVYVIENSNGVYRKRLVSSRSIMNALGYTWEQHVLRAPRSSLPTADGPRIAPDAHADGQAVRASNGTVYLIDNGKKRHIPSPSVLQSYRFGDDIYPATTADLALPNGDTAGYAEGSVVRSVGGTLYIIENHQSVYRKRPISHAALFGFGYKPAEVLQASNDTHLPSETGPSIVTAVAQHPLGATIRDWKANATYSVTAAGKARIPSDIILNSYGLINADIKLATPNPDLAWVTSNQYTSGYGTLSFSPSASGAYGLNAKYEAGQSSVWYVSEQAAGADAIARGVARNDKSYIDAGIKMFDWGWSKQQPNGTFEPQYDIIPSQVITMNIFLSSIGRSGLLIQQSKYANDYAAKFESYKDKIRAAQAWQTQPWVWSRYLAHIQSERNIDNGIVYGTFIHQHYMGAAGFGLNARLYNDASYMPYAYQLLDWALPNQNPAGWNMEHDGYDTGYDSLGLQDAMYWVGYMPADSRTPQVTNMLDKGMAWMNGRILSSGKIDTTGNARTCNYREGGGQKDPGYSTLVWDFGFWGMYRGNSGYINNSDKVMDYLNQIRQGKAQRCP